MMRWSTKESSAPSGGAMLCARSAGWKATTTFDCREVQTASASQPGAGPSPEWTHRSGSGAVRNANGSTMEAFPNACRFTAELT